MSRTSTVFALFLLVVLGGPGCAGPSRAAPAPAPPPTPLEAGRRTAPVGATASRAAETPSSDALAAAFAAAVADARVAEPSEAVRTLVALSPDEPDTLWRTVAGQRQVRLVTWTDWDGYEARVGGSLTLSRQVWVTAAPRLQRFCRALPRRGPAALKLRLEQRLGLAPGGNKDRVVELWAAPADIFRPSADPEVSDHEATVGFPVPRSRVAVSEEHRRWYEARRARSYGEGGYPWTRLGYTYDWGGGPSGEVGESEFVLRRGATVTVHSVTPTASYCAPAAKPEERR